MTSTRIRRCCLYVVSTGTSSPLPWAVFVSGRHTQWQELISLMNFQYSYPKYFNSLAPGRFWWHFRWVNFHVNFSHWWLMYLLWNCHQMNVTGFTADKSTLVQVMACCRQATSHYLSQCWHRSLPPYGVTRPQWVNCKLSSWLLYLYSVLHMNVIICMNNFRAIYRIKSNPISIKLALKVNNLLRTGNPH